VQAAPIGNGLLGNQAVAAAAKWKQTYVTRDKGPARFEGWPPIA
jgi:hypothetical protein